MIHGRISSRRKDSGTNGARAIAGFNPDIRSPDYEVSIRQRPFRFTLRENLTTVESGQLISSLVDLDRVDGGQVMKIEMLAPEAQISLQLGSRSRIQGAVEADLTKISLFCGHALRLQ